MRNDITETTGADPGGAPRRRWSAGVAAVVAVFVTVVGAASPTATTALIPQPTTTSPPRVTTTAAPRSTTTTRPTPPTTTSTAPAPSTTTQNAPTTAPAVATTVPPTTTTVPVTAAADTSTTAGPIPDPPSTPPTSEPVTAALVMSDPVVVDFEDPTAHPPLIINVASTCTPDVGTVVVMLMNVDSYHYPMYFTATYEWSLTDGAAVVDSGTLATIAWEPTSIYLDGLPDGTYSLTVTDTDLAVSSANRHRRRLRQPAVLQRPAPPARVGARRDVR